MGHTPNWCKSLACWRTRSSDVILSDYQGHIKVSGSIKNVIHGCFYMQKGRSFYDKKAARAAPLGPSSTARDPPQIGPLGTLPQLDPPGPPQLDPAQPEDDRHPPPARPARAAPLSKARPGTPPPEPARDASTASRQGPHVGSGTWRGQPRRAPRGESIFCLLLCSFFILFLFFCYLFWGSSGGPPEALPARAGRRQK